MVLQKQPLICGQHNLTNYTYKQKVQRYLHKKGPETKQDELDMENLHPHQDK